MPRLPRLAPIGVPQHLIQRGNNHQSCFYSKKDFAAYAHWLHEAADKNKVHIHAWVFMDNHVHLLATPNRVNAISKMMQSLGRQYVQYFNYTHKRSGTLWEGRYKSCLIDSENYLLACYRYIELNPVRANIVSHPARYYWSSFATNALGKDSALCSPHPVYLSLGIDKDKRLKAYQKLFNADLENDFIRDIRATTNRGLIVGSEQFKDEIENMLHYSVRANPVGRPKKTKFTLTPILYPL